MEITSTGQKRGLLFLRKSNQEEAVSINPQIGRIVSSHGTAAQMHGVYGTDAYSKANLLRIDSALSAINRSSNT
ncbi:hypothetical protein D3C75_1327510 [compost metagenome]